jgi:hypothetical protein
MGNNSVAKFIFRLSRFPVYRGSVLGRFYCTMELLLLFVTILTGIALISLDWSLMQILTVGLHMSRQALELLCRLKACFQVIAEICDQWSSIRFVVRVLVLFLLYAVRGNRSSHVVGQVVRYKSFMSLLSLLPHSPTPPSHTADFSLTTYQPSNTFYPFSSYSCFVCRCIPVWLLPALLVS